ncbi:unnamed protein product, partial [Hymenolepis diminuta]
SYKAIFVFHSITTHACQGLAPALLHIYSLPQHAPLSNSLSVTRVKLVVIALTTFLA